jgi:hypothetical protein
LNGRLFLMNIFTSLSMRDITILSIAINTETEYLASFQRYNDHLQCEDFDFVSFAARNDYTLTLSHTPVVQMISSAYSFA